MSGLPESFRLDNRTVIITGGAGFLGRHYAHTLASAGANVVVADKNAEEAERVAHNVGEVTGARTLAVPVDVADPDSVKALAEITLGSFGRIDALVNNAAIDPKFDPANAGKNLSSFEDFPLELWIESLSVNTTGLFLCSQAVSRAMLSQRSGVIVNISSMYGLVGPDQRLYESDDPQAPRSYKPVTYSVTKSAVFGLTKYLATYWAGKNIRVNTLTLGGVFDGHDPEFLTRYGSRAPLGRMASPSEAANALLFLLSDASSYMTGANLVVDGGWTAW